MLGDDSHFLRCQDQGSGGNCSNRDHSKDDVGIIGFPLFLSCNLFLLQVVAELDDCRLRHLLVIACCGLILGNPSRTDTLSGPLIEVSLPLRQSFRCLFSSEPGIKLFLLGEVDQHSVVFESQLISLRRGQNFFRLRPIVFYVLPREWLFTSSLKRGVDRVSPLCTTSYGCSFG